MRIEGKFNTTKVRYEFVFFEGDVVGDAFYITTDLIRSSTDEELIRLWEWRIKEHKRNFLTSD